MKEYMIFRMTIDGDSSVLTDNAGRTWSSTDEADANALAFCLTEVVPDAVYTAVRVA